MPGLYNEPLTPTEMKKIQNIQERLLSEHTVPSKAPFNAYSNKVFEYNNSNINQNQVFISPRTNSNTILNNNTVSIPNVTTVNNVSRNVSRNSTPLVQNNVKTNQLPGGWVKKQNNVNTWYVSPNGVSQWNAPPYNYNAAAKTWKRNVASGKINVTKNTSKRQTRKNALAALNVNDTNVNINAKYKAMENKLPYFLTEEEWKTRTNMPTKKMGYQKWRNMGIQRMKNASNKANKKRNMISHRGPSGRKSRKNRK